ncbi:hypothetical protein KC573_00515 [candidate division WWE3 bacterium]|uniref:Uncharacterized protein n=1 Tax=candidate division WWE3 bacterium TaxID=2053526 RepID=A0A955RWQ3_UNCKA|nr:hypothetical protein [candidate division WWE3 bacterium]
MKLSNIVKLFLVGLAIVLTSSILVWRYFRQPDMLIASFEDCVAAGYPILESYPEQCNTPDGRHFVRQISPIESPEK